MPSRRTHTKSRHGCVQCKARRIKCDLNRPVCLKCKTRGIKCESNSLEPAPASDSRCLTAQNSQPVGSLVFQLQPDALASFNAHINSTLNPEDVELLHFYANFTSHFLTRDPACHSDVHLAFAKEAISFDFLMHQLLGVAAAHRAFLRTDQAERYQTVSMLHQTRALSSGIPQLCEINIDSCQAMFAFSAMLMVLSFAFPKASCIVRDLSPIDALAEIFRLSKGVLAVIEVSWDALSQGRMKHMFQENTLRSAILRDDALEFARLSDDLAASLETLADRAASIEHQETRKVYESSIQELSRCFHQLASQSGCRDPVIALLVNINKNFIDLFKAREPLALAILAHYAAILHTVSDGLWSASWGSNLIHPILRALGPQWERELRWPKSKFQLMQIPSDSLRVETIIQDL